MNPITNIKNQNALNEREIALGIAGDLGKSWHQKYKESAWIYIGGLPYDLSEGDIIAVFSQLVLVFLMVILFELMKNFIINSLWREMHAV